MRNVVVDGLEGVDEHRMISISQGLQADHGVHPGFEFPVGSWDSLSWVDYKEKKKPNQTLTLCSSPKTAPASCSTPTLGCAKYQSAELHSC